MQSKMGYSLKLEPMKATQMSSNLGTRYGYITLAGFKWLPRLSLIFSSFAPGLLPEDWETNSFSASVSCSGTCLTLEKYTKNIIKFYVSKETLSKTIFNKSKRGDIINLEKSGLEPLPMPLQGTLMSCLNQAAQQADRWDLIRNPSGQIGGMITTIRPARDILMDLVNEAEETIEMLQYNLGSTRKVDIGDR